MIFNFLFFRNTHEFTLLFFCFCFCLLGFLYFIYIKLFVFSFTKKKKKKKLFIFCTTLTHLEQKIKKLRWTYDAKLYNN